MRVDRKTGAAAYGPRPMEFALSLRVACPVCDAAVAERCRVWRMSDGERLYIKGYRVKVHPERTAAARTEALIEASSLGTPEAKALRESVPDEVVDRIMARYREIESRGGDA